MPRSGFCRAWVRRDESKKIVNVKVLYYDRFYYLYILITYEEFKEMGKEKERPVKMLLPRKFNRSAKMALSN